MEDEKIISLYWERKETAITETDKKYRAYLHKISYNILVNPEDSEECVNDTYLKAWNSIPPHRPAVLSAFLGKITRRLSIDRFRRSHSSKRNASQYAAALEELEHSISAGDQTLREVELHILTEAIQTFLRSLSYETRCMFVCRYYFMDSIREIAAYYGTSESKIKSTLHRTRIRLKKYLEQEGYI